MTAPFRKWPYFACPSQALPGLDPCRPHLILTEYRQGGIQSTGSEVFWFFPELLEQTGLGNK